MPDEIRVLKLYCEARDEADQTAAWVTAQGLAAEVGRPLAGTAWAVNVSGAPEALDALAEQVRAQMFGQDDG